MTLIIIIACAITLFSGVMLIGADYEQERSHTKKFRPTKRNHRLIAGRINTKRLNALRKRAGKDRTLSTNKTRKVSKEKNQ